MKIAILSFSFLSPEHISRLKKLGDVVEYQTTNNLKDAQERLQGVEVAIGDCWDVPFKKELFDLVKDLKYVSLNSTGFDHVDLVSAKENGVQVANVPGFSTEAVAEGTVALMFSVLRLIPMGNRVSHEKPFQVDPANRSHDRYLGKNVRGSTLGIIGLGRIGTRLAELAQGLGMNVIAYIQIAKECLWCKIG